MRGPLGLAALGVAVGATAAALFAWAASGSDGSGGEPLRVEGYGLAVELPPGWDGRAERAEPPSPPTLLAANFRLPERSTERLALDGMKAGDVRIILWDYGAQPVEPPDPASLPIAVERAGLDDFEGIPYEHAVASYAFTAEGRSFQLVVDFGGTPPDGLKDVNEVLATLEVE